jgi:hypothetical protein
MKTNEITGNFVGLVKVGKDWQHFAVKLEKGKVVEVLETDYPNVKPIAIEGCKAAFVRHLLWAEDNE